MKKMNKLSEATLYAGAPHPFRTLSAGRSVNLFSVLIIGLNLVIGPLFYWVTGNAAVLWICLLDAGLVSFLYWLYCDRNHRQQQEWQGQKEALEQELLKAHYANDGKKHFIREIVHEIKSGFNPLEGMIAYLGEKERLLKSKATTEQLIAHIKSGAFSFRRLLANLLEFSKIEYAKKDETIIEPVEIRAFMQQVVDEFQYTAQTENTVITLEIAPEMPVMVSCDPVKLRQVANNLVHNAIKFVPAGSGVLVSVGLHGRDNWQLNVINDGEGFSPEKLQQYFHPYQDVRTGINMEGNGLGLFITRKLVESLHGRIVLAKEDKAHTAFEVTFPLDQPQFSSMAVPA